MAVRPQSRPSAKPPIAAASCLVLCAGCASPSIDVGAARIAEQSADAVQLAVDVSLTNPGDGPMRLLQWDYAFRAGDAVYGGRWEALLTIPPGGTVRTELPVVVAARDADALAGEWSMTGNLTFRSPSRFAEIFYDLGLYRPRIGFGGSGAGTGEAAPAVAAAASDSGRGPG
jgi:hypothetical protein